MTRTRDPKVFSILALLAAAIAGAACDKQVEPPAAPPFRLQASIQEIMNSVVDPAADGIWEAFSVTATKTGTEEKRPQTDDAWNALRHQAIALLEGGNLLLIEGRKVAHPGKKLDDEGTPGIRSAQEVELALVADRSGFVKAVHDFQDAAAAVLTAIDARKPEAVVEAGGGLDKTCEACHVKYWYPQAAVPDHARLLKTPGADKR